MKAFSIDFLRNHTYLSYQVISVQENKEYWYKLRLAKTKSISDTNKHHANGFDLIFPMV